MNELPTRPVAWHENLYHAMANHIYYDVEWAAANDSKVMPRALVLGCLHRTVGPLKAFLSQLFKEEEVEVATVDSSRGRMAPIVHFVKHRRTVDAPSWDQHRGHQGDLHR